VNDYFAKTDKIEEASDLNSTYNFQNIQNSKIKFLMKKKEMPSRISQFSTDKSRKLNSARRKIIQVTNYFNYL
jgi:hypothetical protein